MKAEAFRVANVAVEVLTLLCEDVYVHDPRSKYLDSIKLNSEVDIQAKLPLDVSLR
jgi:hypothetical protein